MKQANIKCQIKQYEEYTRSYDKRYVAEISHEGLMTFRILKDANVAILKQKIALQCDKWNSAWSKVVEKTASERNKVANQQFADEEAKIAQQKLQQLEELLTHTLSVDDAINWDSLKDFSKFTAEDPKKELKAAIARIQDPKLPKYKELPPPPERSAFATKLSFFDKLIKSRSIKKNQHADQRYQEAIYQWKLEVENIEKQNAEIDNAYDVAKDAADRQKVATTIKYEQLSKEWAELRKQFFERQKDQHLIIDELKKKYLSAEPNAIIEYCEMVMENSVYPETFPKDFDLEYNPDNKLIIVEYILPSLEHLPRLTDVKYVASRKELKESYLSDAQLSKIYDDVIYKIALRTLHELFEADKANALDVIVFNGWVDSLNKATGKRAINCIISLQAKKSEFAEIDLKHVDPKTCFKNLKGVGSSKLSTLTAIQPLIQVNRNDKRFVASYDVTHTIKEGDNIALIGWEDFEHLLRELFEKEFSANGGEVKVTQASRDGGVDAVAFDPDPIRGGKIVIQAKRYTNTVGVSAVRDLYGTVLNEGATKGILVTTSDYGSDAYEFAKNKPLTLLNGNNLLYLLEKHGRKARIDLIEAKRLQIQNQL